MDSVKLALICTVITAAASLIVAVVSLISSGRANKSRLQQAVLQELLSRRLAAYDDVLLRDLARFPDSFSEQSCNAFVAAIHRACLVASDNTVAKLLVFSDSAADPQLVNYQAARMDAVKAMRADLWAYDTPKITNRRWRAALLKMRKFLQKQLPH